MVENGAEAAVLISPLRQPDDKVNCKYKLLLIVLETKKLPGSSVEFVPEFFGPEVEATANKADGFQIL